VFGWLAAIAVAIVVAAGAPAGASADEDAAVAATAVNLRTDPGTWAPVVGQLWQGERLALLAGPTPDDWYQVQAGDQTGWAYGGLLALDDAGNAVGSGPSEAVDGGERWVDVDRTTQTVTLYEGNVAVAAFWAAMGSDPSDDGFFATAVGTYAVYGKYGGLSWTDWGGAWIGDWVGFDSTRLNGFHTYSMDAAGQVIPGGDGPTGGCVALAPAAADQLFAFVSVGTRVEVHR
jgi:lipoprotein-anchoring transpeptidase ErfK/SrfK